MMETLTGSSFEPYLGDIFTIPQGEGEPLKAELIELNGLPADGLRRGQRNPFSILFRGPLEPVLPQNMYCIEHPGMGNLELFLVPIGPDNEGMRYEAVFT